MTFYTIFLILSLETLHLFQATIQASNISSAQQPPVVLAAILVDIPVEKHMCGCWLLCWTRPCRETHVASGCNARQHTSREATCGQQLPY